MTADVRNAPPITVNKSANVPEGYDDHVIVSVNLAALREQERYDQVRDGQLLPGQTMAYYNRYRVRRTTVPDAAIATPATRPDRPQVNSPSAPRQATRPARSNREVRSRR
ncbi:MAG: hypothetical protein KJO55_05120 [Gammaproteobacteria bacterium]|nr:hypothetical protein [Gammaproteobacteria bacterium]